MRFGMLLKQLGLSVGKGLARHSTVIMCATEVLGLAGSIYFSWKACPKVDAIMNKKREQLLDLENIKKANGVSEEEYNRLHKQIAKSTVRELAKVALPCMVCATVTCGTAIGTGFMMKGKDAQIHSLTSGVAILESSYNELANRHNSFVQAAKESIGEEKTKELIDKSEKEQYETRRLSVEGALQAKGGNIPFYDKLGARVILSDERTIQQVVDQMNTEMSYAILPKPSVSYKRFCELMELPAPWFSDNVVWVKDTPSDRIELNLRNTFKNNGTPMTALDWATIPQIDTSNGKAWI